MTTARVHPTDRVMRAFRYLDKNLDDWPIDLVIFGVIVWGIIFTGLLTFWPYNLAIGVGFLVLLAIDAGWRGHD